MSRHRARSTAVIVSGMCPFGNINRNRSVSNSEFYPLRACNEREFLLEVPIRVTGNCRNVSVTANLRDQDIDQCNFPLGRNCEK